MMLRATGVLIAIALLLPVSASGQAKTPTSTNVAIEKAEAKYYYDQGTVHFNLDEWAQAIEKFKAAYRAYPDANLLYNIAQCHRKMGNPTEAINFYKNYLRERPEAANRAEVEKRIEEMQSILAAQPPENVSPPVASPSPAEKAPDSPSNGTEDADKTATAEQASTIDSGAMPGKSNVATAPAGVDVTHLQAKDDASSKGIVKTWWFWTAVGTAVAAGTVLAILSLSSSSPSHFQGNLEPKVLPVP